MPPEHEVAGSNPAGRVFRRAGSPARRFRPRRIEYPPHRRPMTDPAPQQTPDESAKRDRIPRLAIAVVVVGLLATAAVYAIAQLPGSGSLEIDWDTTEVVSTPPARDLGNGSFAVARSSLSALAPNDEGGLIYRVAGVVRIDSGGRKLTTVRCDVNSNAAGETNRMAHSSRLRAAWPKPSDALQEQEVPETSFVKFRTPDSKKIDLPIRDVVQRYIDTDAPTQVEWDGYIEDDQNWIWTMPNGTGVGAATLPWLVIFKTDARPKGTIKCKATVGDKSARVLIPFRQDEWPIADDQPNTDEAGTGDVSNVQ